MAQTILSLLLAGVAAGFAVIVRLLAEGLTLAVKRKRNEFEKRRLQTPLELVVQRRIDFGSDLFGVTLARPDGRVLPAFRPGQYLTVLIERDGHLPLRRCYSLASWSARPKHYELGIKQVDKGLASSWLHRELKPGLLIRTLPPRGAFVPRQGARQRVLIAGGIGITPLRAMLRYLLARAADARVDLFHAARHVGDLCYREEFQSAV
jgi:ferredoxin-NADP reductase